MNSEELPFLSATQLRDLLEDEQLSPVDVTKQMLRRIATSGAQGPVFSAVCEDEAIASATKAAERQKSNEEMPLLGVPIAISDSLRMKGVHCSLGSQAIDAPADTFDSIEVERIKEAGGVIIGKATLAEFDLGEEVANLRNPWDLSLSAGSTGVASAVASGLATIGIGSDLWGSVRMSASYCGLVGFKPTRGATGQFERKHVPYSQKHFATRGTVTRTVEDAALALEVIAGYQFVDDELTDHEPFKIAVSRDFGFLPIDAEVNAQTDVTIERLREMGHEVSEVHLPLNRDILTHFRNIVASDLYAPILSLHEKREGKLTEKTLQWLSVGDQVTGVQYSLALSYAGWLRRTFDDLFEECDVLLTPTVPSFPFACGTTEYKVDGQPLYPLVGCWATTLPFNMAGHPAVTVPSGRSKTGLPIGMQFASGYFQEWKLLNLTTALQKKGQWDKWRPDLSY